MPTPLSLRFLGTGGAFTRYSINYHNNALVDTEEGPVLIDCGTTAVQSMSEIGVKPWDVAGAIITHTHADHAGGLEQLLWERVYTGPDGPGWLRTSLYSNPMVMEHLRDMLRHPLEEFTDRDGHVGSNGFSRIAESFGVLRPFEIGGVRFQMVKVPHVIGPGIDKPAFGIFIARGGRQMYFSGDTTFNPRVGDLYPNADILFHECSFGPKYPGTVHTHYEDLLTLPDDVRARMVLMHYTSVPAGIDPVSDGFRAAAKRHEAFTVG